MFLFLNSRRKNFYFLKVIIIIITQSTIANLINIEKFEFFEKANEFFKTFKERDLVEGLNDAFIVIVFFDVQRIISETSKGALTEIILKNYKNYKSFQ